MPIATDEDDSGIVTPSPTGFAPQVVPQIYITDPGYKDVAVDTKWTPIQSLLKHVEGSSWTVNYYSQIIDTDTPLAAQSVTVSAPYQQYKLVQGLELKVTSALHQQQDDVTKMMQIDGTALLSGNNSLIPNEGDVIIADIGVGPPAVFRVSASNKKSYFKQAVYEIEYAMVSTNQEYLDDLAEKTLQTLVWRSDFITYGQNPIIEADASATIDSLNATIYRLTDQYFQQFFNPEFSTLTIPSQAVSIYDPFFTNFIAKMFSQEDSSYLQEIRVLNVSDDVAMRQNNFWKAIQERDASYLKTGFTQVGLVYTSQFTSNPFNQGIRWTGIDCCVYPVNPKVGVLGLTSAAIKTLAGIPLVSPLIYSYDPYSGSEYDITIPPPVVPSPPANLVDSIGAVNTMYPPTNTAALTSAGQTGTPIAFYPVGYDAYYVLSANFYNQTQTQSVLEAAVWQYLNGESLDPEQLSNTAALYYNWGVLEQFYYAPLLVVLIKAYIRSYQG